MHSAETLAADAAPDLAALDARVRAEPPQPAVLEANLAALRTVHPSLAARVAAAELPEHWSIVQALDGTVTWRVEPPGHVPAWLGGTAAPRVRAEAILAKVRCDDRNPALPTAGCGWEIVWLLEKLPPAGAAYVFEPDVRVLAAVLRVVPLVEPIRTGRCRFVAADDPVEWLVELLDREPGLLAPGRIVAVPSVPRERLMQLEQVCSQVMDRIGAARQQQIEQIRGHFADRPPAAPPRRLLVAALTADTRTHRLAYELGAARPAELELTATACDAPQRGHMLAHLRAAEAFEPDAVLAVGHEPRPISEAIGRPGLCWHVALLEATQAREEQADVHLAASPAIGEALREAGIADDRIGPLYWATSEAWLERTVALCDRPIDPRRIWLLGDLPSEDPRCFGITHTTHRRLWNELLRVAARVWSETTVLDHEAILRLAAGRCDVHVRDPQIRASFLRLIRFVIVPRAVRLALLRLARQAECDVTAIGAGWDGTDGVRHETDAEGAVASLLDDPDAPRPVVLWGSLPDPLTRPLVQLAAAGLPLLMYQPRRRWLADGLGGVMDPRRDAACFEHARGLLALLAARHDRASPAARAAELRSRLGGQTWSRRLCEIGRLRLVRG